MGGIHANNSRPALFIRDNLLIQDNVIDAAHRSGVGKFVFLGSSCIYPKLCPQPIKEDYLLTGPLEPTNEWYAIAKIAGVKMCQAYRREFGFNAISLMPTNLYGPGDNFDLQNSHVLPALIRRFHEAKVRGDESVTIWGTGTPRREFLHVDDLADAVLYLLQAYDARAHRQYRLGRGCDDSRAGRAGHVCDWLQRALAVRPRQTGWHAAQTAGRLAADRSWLAGENPAQKRHRNAPMHGSRNIRPKRGSRVRRQVNEKQIWLVIRIK